MSNFATLQDVIDLWRPLTPDEVTKVNALLPLVSNCLRNEADKVGKDLDDMIAGNVALKDVARSVTVDVVRRYINDNSSDEVSMSQITQAAGGYSMSGTFLNAGGGLFIKRSELSRLGLRRQRIGTIDYDFDNRQYS